VIIGFGGRTFETSSGLDERKMASFACMGKIMAQSSSVPCAFILNEASDLEIIKKAMKLGFNCVMFDGSLLSLEQNIELTKKVVEQAAKMGVDVEGQVGRIPSAGGKIEENFLTSPQEASYFVKKTGVSALAISVGNGFPDALIKEAVRRGVCKFNVGTILKEIFLKEVKRGLEKTNLNEAKLQDLVGSNSEKDIFKKAYSAVKELIKEKMKLYNAGMIQ